MNALSPDAFEVQKAEAESGGPSFSAASANPDPLNRDSVLYYSIDETIAENKNLNLEEESFRAFLETLAKARGLDHSGLKNLEILPQKNLPASLQNYFY